MRSAVILSAIVLAAVVPEAQAQQSAATDTATSNPIARIVGAVRERLSGPAPEQTEPAQTRKKRVRRSRRAVSSRVRRSARAKQRKTVSKDEQPVPWPVAANRATGQASNVTVLRTSTVRRPIVKTIIINDELLPLPAAEFVGAPVKLRVPSIGDVEIPEDRYPQVFKLLVSENPVDQREALRTLREIRETTDALRDWARNNGRFKNPDRRPQ